MAYDWRPIALRDPLGVGIDKFDAGLKWGRNEKFQKEAPEQFAQAASPLSEFGLSTPPDQLREMFRNPETRALAIQQVQEATQRRADASDPMKQIQLQKAQIDLRNAQRGPAAPRNTLLENANTRAKLGWENGLRGPDLQRFVLSGELPNAAEPAKPFTDVAKLKADLDAGLIDQQQYDALSAQALSKEDDPLINAGNGTIFDPNSKEWITNPAAPAGGGVNFDDISGLRKEVQALPSYKNLAQATPIFNAMSETASRDSRASDLNLVYGLGKIMDPTSVVREGEMFMVQGINTLPDKIIEGVNSLLTGTSTLSPETRKSILTEAYGRVKGYEDAFNTDATNYRDIAGRYKINPEDVLPGFKPLSPWTPPAGPGGGDPETEAMVQKYLGQ